MSTNEVSTGGEGTDSPILGKLEGIRPLPSVDHVVVIDDSCLSTGRDRYPTLDVLRDDMGSAMPTYTVEQVSDMLRVTPGVY